MEKIYINKEGDIFNISDYKKGMRLIVVSSSDIALDKREMLIDVKAVDSFVKDMEEIK